MRTYGLTINKTLAKTFGDALRQVGVLVGTVYTTPIQQ